ncbi:MAG: permease [Alphaproteobacteria bacterium]
MFWFSEWRKLALIVLVFFISFFLPVGVPRFDASILEALYLVKEYARLHIVLCLIPAFFIAGAVGVFINKATVMKYLGAKTNKVLAYSVASVSGTILAVCSCTILPLFAGIYKMGAGLGVASAFLYAGPAINVLAIILTARILGAEMGIARAFCAIFFSVVIGLAMAFIFRKEEKNREAKQMMLTDVANKRNLWQSGFYFLAMIGILVFANWGKPQMQEGVWASIYSLKWYITSFFALVLSLILVLWFDFKVLKAGFLILTTAIVAYFFSFNPIIPFSYAVIVFSLFAERDKGEINDWLYQTWSFAKQILPLLLLGVFIAGMLLGRNGHEGLIPTSWIIKIAGDNSLLSNLGASLVGAFMYFATLTEVPILQGLMGNGMNKGPALALLLAGPAISLPSVLVVNQVLGFRKTATFILLVVIMATVSGFVFGNL